MTFIDITCMSDRSEEVIIETFPRRNDTPFFTTRSCRLSVQTHACFNLYKKSFPRLPRLSYTYAPALEICCKQHVTCIRDAAINGRL